MSRDALGHAFVQGALLDPQAQLVPSCPFTLLSTGVSNRARGIAGHPPGNSRRNVKIDLHEGDSHEIATPMPFGDARLTARMHRQEPAEGRGSGSRSSWGTNLEGHPRTIGAEARAGASVNDPASADLPMLFCGNGRHIRHQDSYHASAANGCLPPYFCRWNRAAAPFEASSPRA